MNRQAACALLRRRTAVPVLTVDQPMQKLGVPGDAPIVRLALRDVGIQVSQRADPDWLQIGDQLEALSLSPSEPDVGAKTDHGRARCRGSSRHLGQNSGPCHGVGHPLKQDFCIQCQVTSSCHPGTHSANPRFHGPLSMACSGQGLNASGHRNTLPTATCIPSRNALRL
jgi:hypothetical protein